MADTLVGELWPVDEVYQRNLREGYIERTRTRTYLQTVFLDVPCHRESNIGFFLAKGAFVQVDLLSNMPFADLMTTAGPPYLHIQCTYSYAGGLVRKLSFIRIQESWPLNYRCCRLVVQ